MAKLSVEQALTKAKSHTKKGELAEARTLYAAILKAMPNNKKAQKAQAILGKTGQRGANQGPPPEIRNQLVKSYEQGQFIPVVEQAQALTKLYPEALFVWFLLGVANKGLGRDEEASIAFKKVTELDPQSFEGHNNLGTSLAEQGRLQEAIGSYGKALSIKPDYAEAYNNMGNALADQGKLDEAIVSFKNALFINPDYAEAYRNMGNAFRDQGKLEEEIEAYNNALSIKHDDVETIYNKSFALLAKGSFLEGFKLHESRWQSKFYTGSFLKSSKPLWNGEKNKSVFVWGEQGIGDQIMYASMIPELQKISSKLIVYCDKRLIPLFQRSFSEDIIYYDNINCVNESEYDFHTPIGSLACKFRLSSESFKEAPISFLRHNKVQSTLLREKILAGNNNKIIGISWSTKATDKRAANRNIGLADLAQTLTSPNTQLVCLQYGDVDDEIKILKKDHGIEVIKLSEIDNLNDIDGLASLIMCCDTIISTTSATVHLAGALGAEVKVLLPFPARWIWGRVGSERTWYKSVSPYQQKETGNWNDVLDCVAEDLKSLI